jgi:hypothetical protein
MSTPPGDTTPARIDAYLDEIAARLPGPRRRRARIQAELRDGLDQTVTDQMAAGLAVDDAVTVAIARFGAPATMLTVTCSGCRSRTPSRYSPPRSADTSRPG